MQGNKKGTDGFSDTSSIGSVLDDADREVSSLTDRAFRSLCVSEDASFSDSDLALSPDATRQVFGNFRQGTVSHAHRKSGIWTRLPAQGTEHTGWAATFQQLPKYVQGEEEYPKSSPPPAPAQRRLEVPVAGLRSSNKPVSKVSSLIKSFDRTEGQQSDRPPASKPPAPTFAPLPESGVNFCFDSAFLTVRRVPAEVSSTHQSGHQPGRKHAEQEAPKSPDSACQGSSSFHPAPENGANSLEPMFSSPPRRAATGEPGRGQGWARKGTFLHSENSAFESWSRQPRLLERKAPAEAAAEGELPRHYEDAPVLRASQAPESQVSPCPPRASCAQEESGLAAGALPTSGAWRSTRDPGIQGFPAEDQASSSQPDLQVKSAQPPWRKPKTRKGGKEGAQDALEEKPASRPGPALYTKHSSQGQFPETDALDDAMDPSDRYNPPFNISELLTPVILTKHVLSPPTSPPAEGTPPPPGQLNGYQETEPSEDPSRDSYRAKAPSLLFNLKDVRKCVKSTYSPSPLPGGLSEKSRGQQGPVGMSNGLPNGLEESPPEELSQETPVGTPLSQGSAQRDPNADPGAAPADSSLTLSPPPATARTPFCVNGEAADRSSHEKDATSEGGDVGAARHSWSPGPREHCPRKPLTLKLCRREPEAGRELEPLGTPHLENGFSRPVSQEAEPEREAGLRNPNPSQRGSPGPLSPEEEDVFYSDSQSDLVPGLKSKAKLSTSSSDQSFASFEDQQKMSFAESPWESRRNDASAGGSRKDERARVVGREEPQPWASGEGLAGVGEQGSRGAWQAEGESVCGERPRKPSREEADFRGTWIGGSKDTGLPHAKGLTPSPSCIAHRHRLFMIKDNTLRATPVIRPVMLPLLRALSSEEPPGGGHGEEEPPRPGWGESAGLCAPKSQEMPSAPTPTGMRGPPLEHVAHKGLEDPEWASSVARMETQGSVSAASRSGEAEGLKTRQDAAWKAVARDGRNYATGQGELQAPRCIPTIALPESDLQGQPPPQQLGSSWEEQTQEFQSHFLSTPRSGPPGGRLAAGEPAPSPNSSPLEGSGMHALAASSLWEDASQGLGEQSRASPWASPSPARAARREDLTHAFAWEARSDPQLEPSAEDLRTLSPGGSLLDVAPGSAAFPANTEPAAHLERAAAKPPAVPPKTEKALRRAKKLASKRRKMDQAQGVTRAGEEQPPLEEAELGGPSPGQRLLPRFPAVRALPPPAHRHSVSTFSEPVRRWPGGPPTLRPLLPYPATQKVLQDPQSGEYYVFDLPLQVKMKTFYDPETGKYVKIPIPSSEEGSPEPLPPDVFAAPYMLYPGIRPLPTTALMPLRCSSQLSAPTFLRQGPGAPAATHPGPRGPYNAERQPAPGPHGEPTPHTAGPGSSEPPRAPGQGGADTPSLGIISTNELEDFATEGIS